jgi:hypothetical protein
VCSTSATRPGDVALVEDERITRLYTLLLTD